jgi:hypothetical protein
MTAMHHIKSCTSDISESVSAATARPHPPTVVSCVKEASPFLVTLLYQGACALQRLYRETPVTENLERLEMNKIVLGVFDTRWKSASKSTLQRIISGFDP